jgi:hypothetical protein
MDIQKDDTVTLYDIMKLKESNLFLGKEAYSIKQRIIDFLKKINNDGILTEAQRREAEKIINDSQKVKKGEIRFTTWRIQKSKDIVGVRMLTENVLWDKGPYWYEDSPFWLSSIRGIIPIQEMKLSLDEEFKTELNQHLSKMNSFWGKIFEQGLWYFISLVVIGIAYGFWKSNEALLGGSIAVGCAVGCVIYLINRFTGLTTSMERKAQFKSWIMPSGEINADEFLSMLQEKIDLWGPAMEEALKEVKVKI